MKKTKVVWNPVTPRPDIAGHFLVWSSDRGTRHTQVHPDWWNGQDPYNVGRVEKYAYLGTLTTEEVEPKKYEKAKPRKKARR